jgi:D-lyxose ketol-isomerase
MITKAEYESARQFAWNMVKSSGLPVQETEFNQIEVADLGLGKLAETGLQIFTLFSSEWIGVKLLICRPNQFFPQHRHPPSTDGTYPGKTELFRVHHGVLYLNIPGKKTKPRSARPPGYMLDFCSVNKEIVLNPGDQYAVAPNTWHWFQAGKEGAIVWSISSKTTDAEDQFLCPSVIRKTVVGA